mgnify:CR=1 FL=1
MFSPTELDGCWDVFWFAPPGVFNPSLRGVNNVFFLMHDISKNMYLNVISSGKDMPPIPNPYMTRAAFICRRMLERAIYDYIEL